MNVVSRSRPQDLRFTSEVERATSHLYDKVKKVIPEVEWPTYAPLIARINQLKAQRNAVILGHNYMTPEIFHCVADITGDSLALARSAAPASTMYDAVDYPASDPNVVAVYDIGQDPGGPFIVMECVEGEDLATLLKRNGPLPPRQHQTQAALIGGRFAIGHQPQGAGVDRLHQVALAAHTDLVEDPAKVGLGGVDGHTQRFAELFEGLAHHQLLGHARFGGSQAVHATDRIRRQGTGEAAGDQHQRQGLIAAIAAAQGADPDRMGRVTCAGVELEGGVRGVAAEHTLQGVGQRATRAAGQGAAFEAQAVAAVCNGHHRPVHADDQAVGLHHGHAERNAPHGGLEAIALQGELGELKVQVLGALKVGRQATGQELPGGLRGALGFGGLQGAEHEGTHAVEQHRPGGHIARGLVDQTNDLGQRPRIQRSIRQLAPSNPVQPMGCDPLLPHLLAHHLFR